MVKYCRGILFPLTELLIVLEKAAFHSDLSLNIKHYKTMLH